MKNSIVNKLFDDPKISSKAMIAFSCSFSGFISSPNSLILMLEFDNCSWVIW